MVLTLRKRYAQAADIPPEVVTFLQFLDEDYPHQCVQQNESITDAHRRAGARAALDEALLYVKKHETPNTEGRTL